MKLKLTSKIQPPSFLFWRTTIFCLLPWALVVSSCRLPQGVFPERSQPDPPNKTQKRMATNQPEQKLSTQVKYVETVTTAGSISGTLKSDSTEPQRIEAPMHSSIKGTSVTFPVGSLAIDTEVVLDEAIPVATPMSSIEIGSGEFRGAASKSVVILGQNDQAIIKPFIISIAMEPQTSTLGLTNQVPAGELVAFYRHRRIQDGKIVQGVIRIENHLGSAGKVEFETRFFGAYQLGYVSAVPSSLEPVETNLPILTKTEASKLPPLALSSRTPFVVAKGEAVEIRGNHFRPTMVIAYAGKKITDGKMVGDTQLNLKIPDQSAFGLQQLTVEQDGVSQVVSLFYRGEKSDLPIMTEVPEKVCEGVKYYDQLGQLKAGTKACSPKSCSQSGESQCVVGSGYKAVAETELNSSLIKSGVSIGGVSGSLLSRPADCNANLAEGCVTTATYKSANVTNLVAGNIKRGVDIAGVTGNFPSSTSPLPRYINTGASADTGGSDLTDLTNFTTQLTSNGSFEYWDSSGKRFTGSGDGDLVSANVKSGVILENFSITGSESRSAQCTATSEGSCVSDNACRWTGSSCQLNPWNIRVGITVGGQSGNLKTNCRNTVNSTYYNYDGSINSLPHTTQTSGSTPDIWDTFDDWYGFSATKVTGWSSNTLCNDTNWTDVTTTNGGSSFTTCGTSNVCIYKDELSGLRVTGVLDSSGNATSTSSPTEISWASAVRKCHSSTYGGYAAGTWRLPTSKELVTLGAHGIVDLMKSQFHTLSNLQSYYWSSTTSSMTDKAYAVLMPRVSADSKDKGSNDYKVLCVRE